MRICLKNIHAIWNDGVLDFFEERHSKKNQLKKKKNNKNNEMSSDWRSRIFDTTSYFQGRPWRQRAARYAAASAGCPLARRVRVTSLACCLR